MTMSSHFLSVSVTKPPPFVLPRRTSAGARAATRRGLGAGATRGVDGDGEVRLNDAMRTMNNE